MILKLLLPVAALTLATPAFAQMQRDPAAMITNADANGDGIVTRAEFLAAREARFARMDRNKDGAISRDDFGRLARFRPQAAERIDALLAEADTNGDGKVTHEEFTKTPPIVFDRADANNDGKVDQSEIAAFKARLASLKQQR